MKIFIWRHTKRFSSWSMFDEPHVYKDNYIEAEVIILANSKNEALELLKNDDKWDIEELKRIEPRIIQLDRPVVISKHIDFT